MAICCPGTLSPAHLCPSQLPPNNRLGQPLESRGQSRKTSLDPTQYKLPHQNGERGSSQHHKSMELVSCQDWWHPWAPTPSDPSGPAFPFPCRQCRAGITRLKGKLLSQCLPTCSAPSTQYFVITASSECFVTFC